MKRIVIGLLLLLLFCTPVANAAQEGVGITCTDPVYTAQGLKTTVLTTFYDQTLYNDQVYLSYHILDSDGETLVAENQRLPLRLNKSGLASTTVIVNCANLPELSGKETAQIQFDLVDEKNAFWFSAHPNVSFDAETLQFDRGALLGPLQPRNRASILLACAVLFIAVLAYTIGRRKPEGKKYGDGDLSHVQSARKNQRFDFISFLRGVACLAVVFSHYGAMYFCGDVSASFSQIVPRQQMSPRFLGNFVSAFDPSVLNFGAFGVSIFFLITGFLAAHSLERDSTASFLIKKLLRLYPVYIAGLAFVYLTSLVYTKWAGTLLPWGIKEWIAQASLCRDWMWMPSVDGIGWTLEVQLKMYLVYWLLKKLRVFEKSSTLLFVMGGGTLLSVMANAYMDIFITTSPVLYRIMYVVIFSIIFLLFGLIGVVFYNFHSGKWKLEESLAVSIGGFICFYVAMTHSTISAQLKSYAMGVMFFILMFLLKEHVKPGRALGFISKISFSVYVIHGINGYYMLSVLDSMGINPYVALAATFELCIILSYAFYKWIEEPMSKVIKKICPLIMKCP